MRSSSPGPSFSKDLDPLALWHLLDDAHAADAPSLDTLHDELGAARLDGFAGLGKSPELGHDESTERVVVRRGFGGRQVKVEGLAHVLEWHARVHQGLALRHRDDHLLLDVVLVTDLPDDLLDEIFDGHEAARAAVLVDDDRDVDLALLHVAQELVDGLRLGDELSGSQIRPDVHVLLAASE